jgi:protein O-GlcNAcase / histone acetyltransferase
VIGDHALGAFLTLSPEFCFVCENSLDGSIVAFVVAAPDAKIFQNRYHVAWLPEMRNKYPRKILDAASNEVSLFPPGACTIKRFTAVNYGFS